MKKSVRKLMLTMFALIVTLAIGTTATYAWFTFTGEPVIDPIHLRVGVTSQLEIRAGHPNMQVQRLGTGIAGMDNLWNPTTDQGVVSNGTAMDLEDFNPWTDELTNLQLLVGNGFLPHNATEAQATALLARYELRDLAPKGYEIRPEFNTATEPTYGSQDNTSYMAVDTTGASWRPRTGPFELVRMDAKETSGMKKPGWTRDIDTNWFYEGGEYMYFDITFRAYVPTGNAAPNVFLSGAAATAAPGFDSTNNSTAPTWGMANPTGDFGLNAPAHGELLTANSYEAARFAFLPMTFTGDLPTNDLATRNFTYTPAYSSTNPLIYAPYYGPVTSQRYMGLTTGEMTLHKKYWIFNYMNLTPSNTLNMWTLPNLYGMVNSPGVAYGTIDYKDYYNADQIEPYLMNDSLTNLPLLTLRAAPDNVKEAGNGAGFIDRPERQAMDCYWGSVRIVIYLDGRDPNCFDAILATSFLSSFAFRM
jgi:hypothetical protein